MLRSQRQRLFFTLPEDHAADFELWDLTVFRYGGVYLDMVGKLRANQGTPRGVMPLLMRGLNRVFTGMLVQNQDELVLATSGSHSQSKTSPLIDETISVPRQQGSFSLECHEDLLAFKAKLLSATDRRRVIDEDDSPTEGELMLRFIEVGSDGRAQPRRVVVRV